MNYLRIFRTVLRLLEQINDKNSVMWIYSIKQLKSRYSHKYRYQLYKKSQNKIQDIIMLCSFHLIWPLFLSDYVHMIYIRLARLSKQWENARWYFDFWRCSKAEEYHSPSLLEYIFSHTRICSSVLQLYASVFDQCALKRNGIITVTWASSWENLSSPVYDRGRFPSA